MSDLDEIKKTFVTKEDLKAASTISAILGGLIGVIASVAVAAFFAGNQWTYWSEIRDEHKKGNIVNVKQTPTDLSAMVTKQELSTQLGSIKLDAIYIGNERQADQHDDCKKGYTYIGPNRYQNHGGFCVKIVTQ